MKKLFTILFALGFLFAIAQENPITEILETTYDSETGYYTPYSKLLFEYDDHRNQILEAKYEWNKDTEAYELDYKIGKEYSEENRLERTLWSSSEIGSYSTTEYSYFENGCLEAEEIISYPNIFHRKIRHLYDENNCGRLLSWNEYYWDEQEQVWDFFQKYAYSYFGTVRLTTHFYFWQKSLQTSVRSIEEYDSRGNRIKYWNVYSDIGEEQWLYEYDDRNNITLFEYYTIADCNRDGRYNLDLKIMRTYRNEYNAAGELIKTIGENKELKCGYELFNSGIYEINYEYEKDYYCDGLLKTELENDRLTHYSYLDGIDCDTETAEINSKIYPNPFENQILIESPLLEFPNSRISVYNAVGRLFFATDVNGLTDRHELDLSLLGSGIYFVQIIGGEHETTHKIVKP